MSSATVSGVDVWDRVWRRGPDARRDFEQIRREERNPRWALALDALTSTLGGVDGLRTVELGSGRGDLSALLAARGAAVTLVDYSETALTQARRRFARLNLEADFVRADLLGDLRGLAGRFDMSCSLGVIEHFKSARRARAVAAHRRALRDGGMAMISAPHAMGLSYRLWKLYLEVRGSWPYGLEIPYGKHELSRLASVAGFRDQELHCTGLWQSLGDHWGRSVFGLETDWVDRTSRLDSIIGATLTLLAWTAKRSNR